ncbi:choice-of-anchor D domain-containing protein [Fodinibacter luteus]|uniref:Choice-of-anchor D domain-containing protein n=1 Tax=Fodinibacter luteus TaxID=552064 RepID=A0ABP8KEA9_9MICO
MSRTTRTTAGKRFTGIAAFAAIALLPMGLATTSAATAPGGGISALAGAQPDEKSRYKEKAKKVKEKLEKKVDQADRDAAAARALQEGALNPLMMVEAQAAATAAAGEAPRYFSHPNYANSPLPVVASTPGTQTFVGNDLIARTTATDSATNVFVVLAQHPLPAGLLQSFQIRSQVDPPRDFHAYVLRPAGANQYSVVFDSGTLNVATHATVADGVATFPVANLAVQAGDVLAFYGSGIPIDIGSPGDQVYYPSPSGPAQGTTITVGAAPFPTLDQPRTYSFGAQVLDTSTQSTVITGGIKKFVDPLPGLEVAVPDKTTYPGSDYYEIGLVEYAQRMYASDTPKQTTLRGYKQLNGGDGTPSYLGPAIVATKDRPVRILFKNQLGTGKEGDLFLPTDTTVMGSGPTAAGHAAMEGTPPGDIDPQKPMCSTVADDGTMKADMVAAGHCYAENRATLHLHGGITPWISDGTPHQWITPAAESTGPDGGYPEGVSVQDVPDMPAAGPGEQTFFYTNAQSARLMFYHDHAWGITRLNVYAGEAAPYFITDATEAALVGTAEQPGVIPGPDSTIPLVIQDKTFVPNAAQLAAQDETWNTAAWGGEGNLWLPHVYSPAQNPGDASGVNAYGRWAYGPWFWPPTNNVENGPIANPYFDPACNPDDPNTAWCEPPLMPGTPYNSMGMEAFMDTPVVNGAAYPTKTLEPKPYRFRILNAANDRFFNLSLYQAVDANGDVCDGSTTPVAESTGIACTEVALNPTEVAAALNDPTVFPTPLDATKGPDWIVMGTEGGFLPAPVVVPAQPTTWVNDPTVFNAGNVDQHSLLVAPAERFDVVVDLSKYAGQTLIVYNDAPAAFPARDPRYDYYTGNGDYRDSGGASSTLPGYGPNTRTVMQIKVADTAPAGEFNLAALNTAFAHNADGTGVFEKGQKPIVVGQGEYNTAYGTTFPKTGPFNGTVQIYDTSLTFNRLVDPDAAPGAPFTTSTTAERLTTDLKPKMIQDEMGEAFEHEYGRMSGFLGVETPNAQAGLQNMILYPYTMPPTEVLDGLELPPGVEATPIADAGDGTQIWKFTHNGVDTHPIHFHLYDVQLLNRVGWDGIIRKPDPTELGWKDTVRVSPLEDTIVVVRPIVPPVPDEWKGLPNSVRLLDPSMPAGAMLADTTAQEAAGLPIFAFNPDGEPIDVKNHYVNFGWEYVLHCHILSHEEMDMMRSQGVAVNPVAPTFISAVRSGNGPTRKYTVTWTDNSKNETAFVVERRVAGSTGPWTQRAVVQTENRVNRTAAPTVDTTTGAATGSASYDDTIGNTSTLYEYQVYAINKVGDTWDYSNPAFNNLPAGAGFPTVTVDSRGTGQSAGDPVDPPTALTGTLTVKNKKTSAVSLSWTDNSDNETGFLIQRTNSDGSNVVNATVGENATTFTQTVTSGVAYLYRVHAFSDTTQSSWSNTLALP